MMPLGGLLRNSVVRITDRPDITLAVYRVCKAINQRFSRYIFTLFCWNSLAFLRHGPASGLARNVLHILAFCEMYHN